jgi:hypothetical protein
MPLSLFFAFVFLPPTHDWFLPFLVVWYEGHLVLRF